MKSPGTVLREQDRGFAMESFFETVSKEFRLTLAYKLHHTVSLDKDIPGNIQRIENGLNGLEARVQG